MKNQYIGGFPKRGGGLQQFSQGGWLARKGEGGFEGGKVDTPTHSV